MTKYRSKDSLVCDVTGCRFPKGECSLDVEPSFDYASLNGKVCALDRLDDNGDTIKHRQTEEWF